MLNLKKTKLLSAVAIAMAASVAPNAAVAGTYTSNSAYENCKRSDTENQILGGVITVYTQTQPVYTQSQPVYSSVPAVQTSGYNTVYTSPRVETVRTVSHNSYGGHSHSQSYGNSYASLPRRGYNEIADINRQIEDLRYRRDKLTARSRYEHSHRLDRRIDRIGHQIADLKKRKRWLKKRNKRSSVGGYIPRR